MKNRSKFMLAALALNLITVAQSSLPVDGSGGINMFKTGKISNLPSILSANSVTTTGYSWEFTAPLQGFVVPASQLTGLNPSGTYVKYEDLLPLKATKLSIMAGEAGAAPTGRATIIDGNGIETNGLRLLDTGTNTSVSVAIVNGVLNLNSTPVATKVSDIEALLSDAFSTSFCDGDAIGYHSLASDFSLARGMGSTALGEATAVGDFSTAIGSCNTAAGESSIAIGGLGGSGRVGNIAQAVGSVALGGRGNLATGDYSYALGSRVHSTSAYSFVAGSQNLSASASLSPVGATGWDEESSLFEVGNGNPEFVSASGADYSNAITTLKNGLTTLTNKEWKAHPEAPLANPASNTDGGGEALVVEGHARLKGKVVIEQPQGDISMGIYGN